MSKSVATQSVWSEHLMELQNSLVAQIKRIQRGSKHNTIKGTSVEVVLRKMLNDYLPGYFKVGTGQIANHLGALSPQLDVIVYDGTAFPHLATNEDGSVIVCSESVYCVVECKIGWDAKKIDDHFRALTLVDATRHEHFQDRRLPAYFALTYSGPRHDPSICVARNRSVGIYCLKQNRCWHSAVSVEEFERSNSRALEACIRSIILECMSEGNKDLGEFTYAHAAVQAYFN